MKLDHERVSDLLHNIALNLHLVRLVCLDNKIFLEGFDRVDLVASLFLGKVNFSE